jgi:predicted ATPase/transcriptional regulator with XRE-family HTH domain
MGTQYAPCSRSGMAEETKMEAPASFGRWLKLRRRILDLTQDQLAREVGCSIVTIRKLESDERRPSRQIAERLAECLRIAPQERVAFIGLARAEPYRDEALALAPDSMPHPAPQRTRSNLPLPLTRLIGRKQEVTAVRSTLLRADTRLLTLSGPPGIGKTRLALQVATELRDAFADGAYFVDLAAIRDPELVMSAIAQVLAIRQIGGRPLTESLQDYLHDKRVLLLLDNFEQVVDAAALIVGLLQGCSGLKALITSRVMLRVRGEQVVLLTPLLLPDLERPLAMRSLAQNPAMALFVERAQAVLPGFALTPTNAPLIAALCTHLDGLPLAIELVAVRVKLQPLNALLAGLDQRLALLTDGPRDLPLRHQTLRAALAGSYELLEQPAQMLFRRLGVFVGGATLEAIEAVCAGEAARKQGSNTHPLPALPRSLTPILSALVEHSLIVSRAASDDAPRFIMLETIREYALELLVEYGEASAARQAHAGAFLDLAERAEPELHAQDQVAWLDHLEAEHPNLRAALEWALQTHDRERAVRLGRALWWFWSVRGYSSEGRRWLDRILDDALPLVEGATSKHAIGPQLRSNIATALLAAGHLALFQGDFVAARDRLGASLAIWHELAALAREERQVQQGLAAALNFLFLTLQFVGDIAAREPIRTEYQTLSATLDDPLVRAMLLFNEGRGALLQEGNYMEAGSQLEQSLVLFRGLGDLWYIAQVVIDLGLVAVYQEDYGAARAWYEEGLTLARALKNRSLIATALNNLGEVARCQDGDERAAVLYAESLQLHQDLGNKPETPRLLHNLGYVALHRGETAQASVYFRDSLDRFQQLGMRRGIAENLAGFAAVAAVSGRAAEAARLWGAAEALHATVGTPVWPTDRREQARYQTIARAGLDTASWEAAWQEGRSQPLAQHAALDETTPHREMPA